MQKNSFLFWNPGGVEPDVLVDSKKGKQGTVFLNRYTIQNPEILKQNSDYLVLISPSKPYSDDIIAILESWGYVKDYSSPARYCLLEEYVNEIYMSLLIKNIKDKLADRKTYIVFGPSIHKKEVCSDAETALKYMENVFDMSARNEWLQSSPPHVRKCYEKFEYYSDEYIKNIFTGSSVLEKNGVFFQKDMISRYVNVSGGMRITTDQLAYCEHRMHFFGPSYMYGFGVEDKYTIPSCMQRKLNNTRYHINCYNYGVRGMPCYSYINKINNVNMDSEDIVVIYFKDDEELKKYLMRNSISYFDLNVYFEKCKDEIYFDGGSHLNYKGNLFVADFLYELIFEKGNYCAANAPVKSFNHGEIYDNSSKMARKWVKKIKAENADYADAEVVGAIVMNCNPFTLGHQYLVGIAAQMVDFLFVFVLSEDCSEFSFQERFDLVKEGTRNFNNVRVVPSGEYMISTITFPEYFSKDQNQTENIDMSLDVDIFSRIIAKELNISIRFVGEEPKDLVTRQYNETLKRLLPVQGIKYIEIPRIKKDGVVVSATTVRKLFHEGRFEEIEKYVPNCTLRFLKKKMRTL